MKTLTFSSSLLSESYSGASAIWLLSPPPWHGVASSTGGSELMPWRIISLSCTIYTYICQPNVERRDKDNHTGCMLCHTYVEARGPPLDGTSRGESTSIRTTRSGGVGENWSSFRGFQSVPEQIDVRKKSLTANSSINASSSSNDNLLLFLLFWPTSPGRENSGGAKPSESTFTCTQRDGGAL